MDSTREPNLLDPTNENSPVPSDASPPSGIGLCLSGGGYRAMLFHLGTLWRLNVDGILPQITRFSSVSGGSITSGMLGLQWNKLSWNAQGAATDFGPLVSDPIRALARVSIFDHHSSLAAIWSLAKDLIDPHLVVDAYNERLFHGATLQDLPDSGAQDAQGRAKPLFVLNATNLMSRSLWRFSRPYMADWRVGLVATPDVGLAAAVAASSAFPVALPPVRLKLDSATVQAVPGVTLHLAPYIEQAVLVDGGVYDNMGIETVWKSCSTVLVSDASGIATPDPHPILGGRDFQGIFSVIDNQVASLRKRQVIASYCTPKGDPAHREGAYWSSGSNIANYGLSVGQFLPCPFAATQALANLPTVLSPIADQLQQKLINWGFAICDAALRAHCVQALAKVGITVSQPSDFPYPAAGV